jgi:hypothetical protein
MQKAVMHRIAQVMRSKCKRSLVALGKPNGPNFKLALFAAALFALAYAAETKAIFSLESSQDLFEVIR